MLIVEILNDCTGTKEVGNYTYNVFVNLDKIASGEIKNHVRANGAGELIRQVGLKVTEGK